MRRLAQPLPTCAANPDCKSPAAYNSAQNVTNLGGDLGSRKRWVRRKQIELSALKREVQVRIELHSEQIERVGYCREADVVIDANEHASGAFSLAFRFWDRVEIVAHSRLPSLEGLTPFLRLCHNLGEIR
jgi:hypothetical protein